MNLGILLPLGESLADMARHGQDVRFVKYYLNHYCKNFTDVYIFSYSEESYPNLPSNCHLICPSGPLHRYLYGVLLPFLHQEEFAKCDVFRCFHPSSAVPAMIAKTFYGKRFIFNYNYNYSSWAKVEKKEMLVPFLKLSEWLAFKLCGHVFVADEQMQSHAYKFISKKKVTIVRNAVDVAAFRPRSKVKKKNKKIVLSVGRLETQKNYSQLIDAVSLLTFKNTKLLLVGKGTLRDKLIHQANEKKVDLEIIDVVPNNRLPQIYNLADVYVQPSLMEAPVKTLLEAMSCARPCVATNVVGIRDVISDGNDGLLAQLDSRDLKDKIDSLLTDKNLAKKIGSLARKKIVAKYNLLDMLNLEVQVLKSL